MSITHPPPCYQLFSVRLEGGGGTLKITVASIQMTSREKSSHDVEDTWERGQRSVPWVPPLTLVVCHVTPPTPTPHNNLPINWPNCWWFAQEWQDQRWCSADNPTPGCQRRADGICVNSRGDPGRRENPQIWRRTPGWASVRQYLQSQISANLIVHLLPLLPPRHSPISKTALVCLAKRWSQIQISPARIYGSDSIESSCNCNQPLNKGHGDLNVSKRIQNDSCYSVGPILKPVALQGICVGSVRRCSLISCRPQLIAGDRVNPLQSPITRASPASREDGPILKSLPLIQVNALKDKGLSLRPVEQSLTFDNNTLDTNKFKLKGPSLVILLSLLLKAIKKCTQQKQLLKNLSKAILYNRLLYLCVRCEVKF